MGRPLYELECAQQSVVLRYLDLLTSGEDGMELGVHS